MSVVSEFIYRIIGRSEKVSFPDFGVRKIPAKIDTGAKTSALWASDVKEQGGGLEFNLFGPGNAHYTGKRLRAEQFEKVVVASSIGEPQERYKIQATVKIHNKKIKASFTLADRSKQAYPVLLGRNVLRGKFLVDVKTGKPDTKAERARTEVLQSKPRKEDAL